MDGGAVGDNALPPKVQPRTLGIPVGVDPSIHADLVGALGAYPQLSAQLHDQCIWLTGLVKPVASHPASAAIKIAYPLDTDLPVRAWAWWPDGTVIGPRHTNPDGSACVYEPGDQDGCWVRMTDSLVTFLDMFMVWIVRHCFLIEFGRWPGRQILHTAFERLEQQQRGELCGCGALLPYAQCHAEADRVLNEADHLRIFGGIPELTRREILMRRQVPRSAAQFDAAAVVPAPELWATRLRQQHAHRSTRTARVEDIIRAATCRSKREPPICGADLAIRHF